MPRQRGAVPLGRVLCHQDPGQGDVLELAQVAELVVGRQTPLLRPSRARRRASPCASRSRARTAGDRPHVRGEVAGVDALRLVEQLERAVEVALGLAGGEPSRRASGTGSAAARCARRARWLAAGAAGGGEVVALAAAPRSSPTCMSAVPRSGRRRAAVGAAARPARRCASRRRAGPAAIRMSASAIEQPRTSAMCPARSGSSTRSAYAACAASRSPVAQCARPSSAAAAAARQVVVRRRQRRAPAGVRRSSPARSPPQQGQRGPVHRDRAGAGGTRRRRRRPSGGGSRGRAPSSSHRSASCRRALDAVELAAGQQRPDEADAEHRPAADDARRGAPRASRATSPPAGRWRMAGSGQLDQVGRPVEVAGGQRVADRLATARRSRSYQSLARRCSSGDLRRAARRAGAPAARRRTGGGSGTTGAGRRAGRGTGCARSSASSIALPPSRPVTASHSGPVSRSRIDGLQQEVADRRRAGAASTSSTR